MFHRLYHYPFFILFLFGTGLPITLSGVVTDQDNANKPIPGVSVSSGNSLIRTNTDSLGRFSIDAPLVGTLSLAPSHPGSYSQVPWDQRKGIMDFSKAPGIKTISIFSLNGACLFSSDIRQKNRVVRIPTLARGVFILKALFNDEAFFSWKWTTLEAQGFFKVPLIYGRASGTTAAATAEALLSFRHDDYYPVESRFSAPAANLVVAMKPDPRRTVFDDARIHSYYFTVTHDDSIAMEKTAFQEVYVPADFSFDSVYFGKVGLRFKGSKYNLLKDCFDSMGRVATNPLCAKVSMKVKFDKYDDTARFYSLKRLNMHAMSDDQSKMHEMLCYRLFRDMGIYAPRTAYMKLFINGAFQGLFLAVEEIDGRFTKARWPEFGNGNLFKEVWPNRADRYFFESALVTNDSPLDSGNGIRMAAFARAVLSSTKETFVKSISPFMDLDYWVRYFAVDRAIHNADGIMTWYCNQQQTWNINHNYYFYQEENSGGKIWLVPWDLPATLSKTDPIIDDFGMPDWYVEPDTCAPRPIWSGNLGLPPHCDRLTGLTADALWDNFAKAGEQFLATCFNAGRMKKQIDDYSAFIEPVVTGDRTINLSRWQSSIKDLRMTMDILNTTFDDYVHKRTPLVDTSGFHTLLPDSGYLSADRINNFEFTSVMPTASWSQTFQSKGSTLSLLIDTIAPLWGKSDLLCTFAFATLDTPAGYAEWADVQLSFRHATDLKNIQRIKVHLKYDSPRGFFVYLLSDSYDRLGAKNVYGWWSSSANTQNKQYTFEMSQIDYPTWGSPDDPDILDSVLTTVTGIGFSPRPRFNNAGKLSVVPDSGYLRVDNVIFEQ